MNGKLYLIGCGPGDADLLTLKALKTIEKLDVALIDHLLTQEIIDLIPPHTKVVFVGKEKGKHSFPQGEINAMITEYALQGYTVGRLKCGDPYIFGRGTEEAIYASQEGIDTEVIPGISSALSGPLSAGIAPTARGVSTGVSVVSAHLSGDRVNLSWIPMLNVEDHTTVVLMGLSRTQQIVKEALDQGVDAALPVAIISNATTAHQSSIITTLGELITASKGAPKPAILVFGNVVNLAQVLPTYRYEPKENRYDIVTAS
ncbi:MAG: uroporphyrinogen-III C-methyltransferase [Sulfuricurvum sp. RIFOXYD2_FULL_44_160]|uniref:uroporphyrinogen-III C-methyltransferase n=1 Tax=unclassified Sulfuricurvum TaxID=2632390 RepID=UPI0008BAD793|nr:MULTISPECIES: uroporphyrinogen-III C-methyltransferase [unclassified Sulfuricurvum]OHD92075.1 MAG: uroporphyrinogen-III C-methyltransferase [Sulfuricurvum sp. RIFOXYD12_FULL_44_77]OHD93365.1 MAG: uroporphyrinogen-III C-methyltransferase [Sulfuricurvum sp. RIFOXYD2_FULL_44_160]